MQEGPAISLGLFLSWFPVTLCAKVISGRLDSRQFLLLADMESRFRDAAFIDSVPPNTVE
jgi:hypothetical protein